VREEVKGELRKRGDGGRRGIEGEGMGKGRGRGGEW